jgi:hypothetical protein
MVWFWRKTESNWIKMFSKFIIIELNCLSFKPNRTVKMVRFYGSKPNHNQLFTKENRTELIIMNRTELFQFCFKIVSYDFFLVQFSLAVRFNLFDFFAHPYMWHRTLDGCFLVFVFVGVGPLCLKYWKL